jgi:HSP20 family protein
LLKHDKSLPFLELTQYWEKFMAIVHWTPLHELETLQQEMNQLFDALTPNVDQRINQRTVSPKGTAFVPAAELRETPEAIYLRVELPGMDAKALDVQVMAEAVSISGTRQAESHLEKTGVVRSEFRYGRFQRVIPLPAPVQNDKVEADYTNGILSLTLPKVEAEKHKVVKVNLG